MTWAFADYIQPHIRTLHAYTPGLQLNDPDIIKLNTNENPFPVDETLALAIKNETNRLHLYPDATSSGVRSLLAERHGMDPDQFLIGNGSDEILSLLFRAFLSPEQFCVSSDPAYSLYPVLAGLCNARIEQLPVLENWRLDFPKILHASENAQFIILTHPNAPTALIESADAIEDLLAKSPCPVILDEAYIDFNSNPESHSFLKYAGTKFPGLIAVQTMSKSSSLAGMRTGFCAGHPDLIFELNKIKDSYNVSRIAQAAMLAILKNNSLVESRIKSIIDTRASFIQELESMSLQVLPSSANFVFARPPSGNAGEFYEELKARKILVRHFNSGRLKEYLRISIGTPEQMKKVAENLAQILKGSACI